MNERKLFKELNKLCEEMSESYDINNGGCCFVAACLAEQLEKYNIPYIVCVTYAPTHYCIKVSDTFINRDEFMFEKDDYRTELNSEDLYETYYTELWNSCYNRKWNLIVKTRIKSVFRHNENRRERLLYGAIR